MGNIEGNKLFNVTHPRKMPKLNPPLTSTKIKNIKPSIKPITIFDGNCTGLHLFVTPSGAKSFKLKFKIKGKDKRIVLGNYSKMTLLEARGKALELKKQIADGIDPTSPQILTSFRVVAERFVKWKEEEHGRSNATITKYRQCLENDLFPEFADQDIKQIHTSEIVNLLEKINKRSNSLALKNKMLIIGILRYAIQRGERDAYTLPDLKNLICPKKPALKNLPENVPSTYKKINNYRESIMQFAMKLQFHFFVRGSEIMGAKWCEIDFKNNVWNIPAERMKMKLQHVVPLTKQSLFLLSELKKITGGTDYLFPSPDRKNRSLLRDSLSKAFRVADLKMTPHNCRILGSTWLRNEGFAPYLVEAQLAHTEKNAVAAAYLSKPHLLYIEERKKMMKKWSDHLCS